MTQIAGTAPDQVPTNADLGPCAYMGPENLVLEPQLGTKPKKPGQAVLARISDTQLQWVYLGLDNVLRYGTVITVA